MTERDHVFVEMSEISKSYGGVPVLSDVSLDLRVGEIVVVAGENGAGKSTLLKILAGLVSPDSGRILVGGEPARRWDPRAARRAGIGIIPQELAPVPDLSIYENIYLGREITTRAGTLDRGRMIHESEEMLSKFGIDVDPRAKVRTVSTATQQLVEIVKTTSAGCRVLLLDEPTSAISTKEVDHLFVVLRELSALGVSMAYTTHKMAEMRAIANRVVVLRDGKFVAGSPISEITDDEIIHSMIGRPLGGLYPRTSSPPANSDPVLVLDQVEVRHGREPISLSIRPGEFVALAGLMGAGRSSLLETIFGIRKRFAGEIAVSGTKLARSHRPTLAIKAGLALVPEDRKVGGLVLGMNVLTNGILPRLGDFSIGGFLKRRRAASAVVAAMKAVLLKYDGLYQEVGQLSGGNQQKVVVGRWLTGQVKVLLLDEPTRGVDVGARGEIYRIMTELADQHGVAILFASSDMAEVVGLAHRILVLRDGAIVDEIDRGADSDLAQLQDRIFRAAAGIGADHETGTRSSA